MKIDESPAVITDEIVLTDNQGVLESLLRDKEEFFPEFDIHDIVAATINDDKTVNIDPEGIADRQDGGFWVVSEGNGNSRDDLQRCWVFHDKYATIRGLSASIAGLQEVSISRESLSHLRN